MAKKKRSDWRSAQYRPPGKTYQSFIYILGAVLVILLIAIGYLIIREKGRVKPEVPSLEERLIPQKPEKVEFEKGGELTFVSAAGDTLKKIDIEVARTIHKKSLGMMYREEMTDSQGMYFIFPVEEPQSFWMKNTPLPLDIVFVNSNKTIVKIHADAQPLSENHYPSIQPARFVVEVRGGFTTEYNINEGDKIVTVVY
jgi:uncharacterized membrane protein (UPF0127 family)